jgi:hypothetical protein
MMRAYKIYIDGVYRGKIKRNATKDFEVGNGTHVVVAKMDWCRSNKLCVSVNDSIVEVEVGNSFVVGKFLVNLEHMTFSWDEALWLKEKVLTDERSEDIS